MFLLANKYNFSIINDFSNLVNLKNYKILNLVSGDTSKLSFLNSKIKKQHKKKLLNLLIVELLGLQKSFLKIYVKKGKKKTIYIPSRSMNFLNKNMEIYYLYCFAKINIGSMHTIQKFGLSLKKDQKFITLKTAFDLIFENLKYFSNLSDINYDRSNNYYNKNHYYNLAYGSFYKKNL